MMDLSHRRDHMEEWFENVFVSLTNPTFGTKRVTKPFFVFLTHKLVDRSFRDVNVKVTLKK
jgi:hypothetical protein